ncbi:Secretory peroxidase [Sesbania bispinosa]|nr:Secretory peroxidase [Sesbania bispinosa]
MFGFLGVTRLYASDPPLTLDYYASTCPTLFDIVRKEMECAVLSDPRNAASIVRLHFHDCFIQGCDGSILLDDTVTIKGEKKAATNIHSLKGFGLIDRIKNLVESECPGIVSCADILTIAARDAVILVGGPYWDVPVGRKDSVTASFELATTNLPTPDESLVSIIPKFLYQGLSVTDMVALVDQEMYSSVFGIGTRELVKKYAADPLAFFQQFSDSMVKMGNITNSESFITGEVRKNCRFVNT